VSERPKGKKSRHDARRNRSICTFEDDGEPNRCRARNRQGKRCGNPKVTGRTVCRMHGGHAGRPPTSGRRSMALGRLQEAYEEAKNDPTLLDLKDTLAVLDLVMQKAAEHFVDSDTPELRQNALELLIQARAEPEPEKREHYLDALEELLRAGANESDALENLAKAAERLARRKEKAWGIKLDAAVAMNARDMIAVLARLTDFIMEEAPRDAAGRIIRRIDQEIMGAGKAAVGLDTGEPG